LTCGARRSWTSSEPVQDRTKEGIRIRLLADHKAIQVRQEAARPKPLRVGYFIDEAGETDNTDVWLFTKSER
jgi:hypothetical protein